LHSYTPSKVVETAKVSEVRTKKERKRKHAQELSRDIVEHDFVEESQRNAYASKSTTEEGTRRKKPASAHSYVGDNATKVFSLTLLRLYLLFPIDFLLN